MQGFVVPDSDRISAPPGGLRVERLPEKPPAPNLPTGYRMTPEGNAELIPGVPPPAAAGGLTSEDRGKFSRQLQGAKGLRSRIAEIEQLYADSFRGAGGDTVDPITGERTVTKPGLGSAVEYLPGKTPIIGRPVNEVFKNAGGSLMGDLAAAYGLTAQQQNTPTELEIRFGPFIPKPGDPDEVIEKKIKRLKEVADEQERQAKEALGVEEDRTPVAPGIHPPSGGAAPPPVTGGHIDQSSQLIGTPGPGNITSSTGTKLVTDEKLAAIAPQIGAMISRGLPAANIRMFMQKQGVDPSILANLDEIIRQRSNPKSDVAKWIKSFPGKPYPVNPQYEVPLAALEKVGAVVSASAPGAAAMNWINSISAGNLGNITDAMGADPQAADMALRTAQTEHPYASLAGSIGGGTAAALGGEAVLGRLGVAPGLARRLLADTTYGGVSGASNAENGNYLSAGTEGALKALAGSLLGQGVTSGLGRAVKGVTSPSVRSVAAEGVPLTVGQAVGQSGRLGQAVKGVEDRLAGLPGVGDVINARRTEGIQRMNAKAFDKALEPVGASVGGKVGEEAVAHAQDAVGQAFTKALGGKTAGLDPQFLSEALAAKNAIGKLPRVGSEVSDSVDEIVKSYFDPSGQISGENMQLLLRDLQKLKNGYGNDPIGYRVGKSINMLEGAVENLFRRQHPDVIPQYDAAKLAFKRLSTLENAVLRATNTGGVFTPAQLGMAIRENTKKYDGVHAAAAGRGELHDFQRAMQDVLPNRVPDSGTAGRLAAFALPAALAGTGAGVGYAAGDTQSGATTGLTLAGLLAMAYSRYGQRALAGAALNRSPAMQKIGQGIKRSGRVAGAALGTQAALPSP